MITARKLVDDFATLDFQWRRPLEPLSKAKAAMMSEVFQQAMELTKKHKVTVLLNNQTTPHGDAGTFALHREDWHRTIRFLPNIEQFRFPRSKKKRIRKKWSLKPANWRKKKRNDVFFVSKARPFIEPSKRLCFPRDTDPMFFPMRDTVTGEGSVLRMSRSMYGTITDAVGQAEEAGKLGYDITIERREDGKFIAASCGPIKTDAKLLGVTQCPD